ncbi:MAG: GntR family transcriptional regulator [Pseudomonadota bacterium]
MKAAEKIRLAIEDAVATGALLPGDIVNEAELISRYGVSRTPVREALLQLQAQGMLTSLPRGGMLVTKMDVSQLLAMWELLAELEGICARLACERMTADERAELTRIHEESAAAVESGDREAWRAINMTFHELIYNGARNPYLRQQIMGMRSRTGAYREHAFAALGTITASWAQHAELVDAVNRRDEVSAAKAMVRHLSPDQGSRGFAAFVASLPKQLLG